MEEESARESHPEASLGEGSSSEGHRGRRTAASRRLPKRFCDLLPEGHPAAEVEVANAEVARVDEGMVGGEHESGSLVATDAQAGRPSAPVTTYRTLPNAFGILREYRKSPLHIPDDGLPLNALKRRKQPVHRTPAGLAPTPNLSNAIPIDPNALQKAIRPFPNISTFRLASWFQDSNGNLSRGSVTHLVKDVLSAEDYVNDDVNFEKMEKALDSLDRPAASRGRGVTVEEVVDEGDQPVAGADEGEEDGWEYCDGWLEETVKGQD